MIKTSGRMPACHTEVFGLSSGILLLIRLPVDAHPRSNGDGSDWLSASHCERPALRACLPASALSHPWLPVHLGSEPARQSLSVSVRYVSFI